MTIPSSSTIPGCPGTAATGWSPPGCPAVSSIIPSFCTLHWRGAPFCSLRSKISVGSQPESCMATWLCSQHFTWAMHSFRTPMVQIKNWHRPCGGHVAAMYRPRGPDMSDTCGMRRIPSVHKHPAPLSTRVLGARLTDPPLQRTWFSAGCAHVTEMNRTDALSCYNDQTKRRISDSD